MSKIEWTEATWNPSTGCNKISEGCKNCYAEIMARRLKLMGVKGYEKGFELKLHPDRLKKPLLQNKPTTYFVNSMSDLFHKAVPFSFIDKVFKTIKLTPKHRYQILTKRPEIMLEYCKNKEIPDNCILGVSVENKKALARVEIIRKIKAKKFLSIEPLLEDLGADINFEHIDWVIVGGESGFRARPMKKEWVLNIKNYCFKNNIPFFFKQWGTYGEDGIKRNKKINGRKLENKEYNQGVVFI